MAGAMIFGSAISASASAGNSDSWILYNHAPSTQKLTDTVYLVAHGSGYNLNCPTFSGGGASRKIVFSSPTNTITSSTRELTTTGNVGISVKIISNEDVTFNLALQNSSYGCQASGTVSTK